MLGTPFACVCRIHRDHCDPAAGRDGGETGAKTRGGDTGHGAAETFPSRSAAHRVAAGGAGVSKAEIRYHNRSALLLLGEVK